MNARQRACEASVTLAVATLLALVVVMAPTFASAWTERDLVANGLHGTLTMPDGEQPVPAVLILPGSGPVDRDGNTPDFQNNSLKLLAHGLAGRGIASLRIDKRGIGASRAAALREQDLRFATYVDDAVNWAAVLGQQPRIGRVILLGHSEGALVGTLVAQRMKPAGLILIAGAADPAGRVIERQLAEAAAPAALQTAAQRALRELEQGRSVADIPAELAPFFRASVQNYVMSWLSLDPAKELAKVERRVLIMQGTTDLQSRVVDAQRLQTALPSARLVLIEGMNHILKDAPLERAANINTYFEPDRPLAPTLIPAIETFIGNP